MTWFDFILLVDWGQLSTQWGKLIMLSFLTATVRMYLSGKKFTFFHYCMEVLVAILAAHIGAAFCEWQKFEDGSTTGVIAVFAYTAPHILEGLTKFVQYIFQNPKEFLTNLIKMK